MVWYRHYDLRRGDNVADIQVNLVDKKDRSLQSHEIARQMRVPVQVIAAKYNANVKIVEVPPGPPVLSTLVAEVYGPDYNEQIKIAKQVKALFNKTTDVVDADWMVEADQPEYHVAVDKEKAMRYGVAPAQVTATVNAALSGMPVGNIYQPASYNQTAIKLQLSDADKTNMDDILDIKVMGMQGNEVPIRDLVTVTKQTKAKKHLSQKSERSCLCAGRYGRKPWKVRLTLCRIFRIV